MSKEIKGIVKLTEYDSNYYFIEGTCTHVPKTAVELISDPVNHVQPEPKYNVGLSNLTVTGGKDGPLDYFKIVASPKLIARAGQWVKPISFGDVSTTAFTINKPYELLHDLHENGTFWAIDDKGGKNGYGLMSGATFEICPAPVQRKSIGVYNGTEIYEDTKAWFVGLHELKIYRADLSLKDACSGGGSSKDSDSYSKVYLSPKEADERLKSEVKKVAQERNFTAQEVQNWQNDIDLSETFMDYAIELVEKEMGITYLEE